MIRFADIFAGIGGFRKPFEEMGGKCVFTSEIDKFAWKTYRANFAPEEATAYDIREWEPHEIPKHDLLLAGFPCQPFSSAGVSKRNSMGKAHGFEDKTQGTLFFELAKIINFHRPKYFVFENVSGLYTHDKGRTIKTMMNALQDDLGYTIHARLLYAGHWLPQARYRVFIVGFRDRPDDFTLEGIFEDARHLYPGPQLGEILQKPDEVDDKYTLSDGLWKYLQDYKRRHTAKGNGFGFSLVGPYDITRTLSARYGKDGSEILVRQDGKNPRKLTPRECSRLQGFDTFQGNDWIIPVSDTQAYKQFGNAVPVPVVRAIAKLMFPGGLS